MYPNIITQIKTLFSNLATLRNDLGNIVYPIGSIYMSMNDTDPAILFGGIWEALPAGRVLIQADESHKLGETGGASEIILTEAQLPAHTHANTLAKAGGHSHTRGSMEITGKVTYITADASDITNTDYPTTGAFRWLNESYSSKTQLTSAAGSRDLGFVASRDWSGSTSTVDNHNHTITNASTGGGSAVNIEQPWLAVYMWKRTA